MPTSVSVVTPEALTGTGASVGGVITVCPVELAALGEAAGPTALRAVTRAAMVAPDARLNGVEKSSLIGMLQVKAQDAPKQEVGLLTNDVTGDPVAEVCIATVNPLSAEACAAGAVQVMTTSVPLRVITGAGDT